MSNEVSRVQKENERDRDDNDREGYLSKENVSRLRKDYLHR